MEGKTNVKVILQFQTWNQILIIRMTMGLFAELLQASYVSYNYIH